MEEWMDGWMGDTRRERGTLDRYFARPTRYLCTDCRQAGRDISTKDRQVG